MNEIKKLSTTFRRWPKIENINGTRLIEGWNNDSKENNIRESWMR